EACVACCAGCYGVREPCEIRERSRPLKSRASGAPSRLTRSASRPIESRASAGARGGEGLRADNRRRGYPRPALPSASVLAVVQVVADSVGHGRREDAGAARLVAGAVHESANGELADMVGDVGSVENLAQLDVGR